MTLKRLVKTKTPAANNYAFVACGARTMKPLLHETGEVPIGIESEFQLDLYFLTAEKVSSELFVAVKKSSKFSIYSLSKPVLEGLFLIAIYGS